MKRVTDLRVDVFLVPSKMLMTRLRARFASNGWRETTIFGVIIAANILRRSDTREGRGSFCRGFSSAAGLKLPPVSRGSCAVTGKLMGDSVSIAVTFVGVVVAESIVSSKNVVAGFRSGDIRSSPLLSHEFTRGGEDELSPFSPSHSLVAVAGASLESRGA